MQLVNIEAINFRCLKCVSMPIHRLTVLIGENDSGKSSILDLLDIALNSQPPEEKDYYREGDGSPADHIEVTLTFEPDQADKAAAESFVASDGKLYVRKNFTAVNSEAFVKGPRYEDNRLQQDFTKMTATELDAVIEELGIMSEGRMNKEIRLRLIADHKEKAPTREDWVQLKPTELSGIVPRFERYRAIDYKSPESLVAKTLRTVYENRDVAE